MLALSRTILARNDLTSSLLKRTAIVQDIFVFNLTLPFTPTPITNQRASGRCWLFSSTNVLRYAIATNPALSLSEDTPFQLSQSFLFFYDKLEKANYFLESTMELASSPLDDRLVQFLGQMPLNDGGQWDMVVNLLEKYGCVPQPVFPESFSSSNSGAMGRILTTKLREHALLLRKLDNALKESEWHVRLVASGEIEKAHEAKMKILRRRKEEFMKEIYSILTICLGVPPKPDEEFTWEYQDKSGKPRSWKGTSVQFCKEFSGEKGKYPPTEMFSLINDPRNEYEKLYTVERLGNVWGGKPVRYVNTTSEAMKDVVVQVGILFFDSFPSLKSSSVSKRTNPSSSAVTLESPAIPPWVSWTPIYLNMNAPLELLWVCTFNSISIPVYSRLQRRLTNFSFSLLAGLSKADRLTTSESSMTHAMVITAVHLDPTTQKPLRYKVENSWGDTAGEKGFFIMTDKWFDEYVPFKVAFDSSYLLAILYT